MQFRTTNATSKRNVKTLQPEMSDRGQPKQNTDNRKQTENLKTIIYTMTHPHDQGFISILMQSIAL